MLNRLREATFAALNSKVGDKLAPIRLGKKAALYVNDVVGRPLADADELERRAAFEAGRRGDRPKADPTQYEDKIPAVLWHKGEQRDATSMRTVLDEAGLDYDVRDVEGDLPTIEALHREGGGQPLPLLFVGGSCVGGVHTVRRLVASGDLQRMVSSRVAAAEEQPEEGALGDKHVPAQVYGTETCSWTGRARALFEREDIAATFIDLDSPEGMIFSDRLRPETGHNTQPWIYLRGEFIGGYNALDEIARLGQLADRTRGPGDDANPMRSKVVIARRENTDENAPADVLDRS